MCAALVAGCAVSPLAPAPAPTPTPTPAPPPPSLPALPAQYLPVSWDALPGWRVDRTQEVWPALLAGCGALVRGNASSLWQEACTAAALVQATHASEVRTFFEQYFNPYAVTSPDGRDTGLVTGYYEPLLMGSREPTASFRVPLYAPPEDLLTIDLTELYAELKDKRLRGRVEGKRVIPYWPRADIEAGKAMTRGRELAYVGDPVEAFFLQIQGSGRIALADGSVMRVGYADQNGQPYRAIGSVLADRGEIPLERTSMQNIREWGQRNPEKLSGILDANPSYVFFREVPPPMAGTLEAAIDGPIGSLGVPLLARRTIAADTRSIPLGAPVYIATTYPSTDRALQRLVMTQDTGGAIRGAVRADFFWGFGDDAGQEAGRMRQEGRMWLLWPKGAPLPNR